MDRFSAAWHCITRILRPGMVITSGKNSSQHLTKMDFFFSRKSNFLTKGNSAKGEEAWGINAWIKVDFVVLRQGFGGDF